MKPVLDLVKIMSKRALKKSLVILAGLLQKTFYKINDDVHLWLERLANLGLIYKGFIRMMFILDSESVIYTLSKNRRLVATPAFLSHEPEVLKIFAPRQGEVVVDIGAYVGRYSLMASRCVGKDGMVIAVEAHPDNYQVLLKNMVLNKAENIIPINKALLDWSGTCELHIADTPGGHSIYEKTVRSIEIPCITLDELLKELGVSTVNWIKVDVEGAEYEVLHGMKKILKKNPHLNLIIEMHPEIRDVSQEIFSGLVNMGFNITCIDPQHKVHLARRPC